MLIGRKHIISDVRYYRYKKFIIFGFCGFIINSIVFVYHTIINPKPDEIVSIIIMSIGETIIFHILLIYRSMIYIYENKNKFMWTQ